MPLSEPSQVEVQQAATMVTEPMDTEPITSGSWPEKPVVEDQMPEQVPSISVVESTEAMAMEPIEPIPQEREVAHSELVQSYEPSVIEVQVQRTLEQISVF